MVLAGRLQNDEAADAIDLLAPSSRQEAPSLRPGVDCDAGGGWTAKVRAVNNALRDRASD